MNFIRKRRRGVSSKARLISKEYHMGVEDSVLVDAPGTSGYYKCVYRYPYNGRDKTFCCRIVGEPPVVIRMEGRHVSGDDPVVDRMTRDSRSSFTQYRDEDDVTFRMILFAMLPGLLCILVGVIMFCAAH